MRSQSVMASRLNNIDKVDVMMSPLQPARAQHFDKRQLRKIFAVRLLTIVLFTMLFFSSFLIFYLPPFIGGDHVGALGTVHGFSEITACFFSGTLVLFYGERKIFRSFGMMSVLLMSSFYIFRETLLSGKGIPGICYYYLAAVSFSGSYNVLYLVVETETPPEYLGATMNLGLAVSQGMGALSFQVLCLPMPIPIVVYIGFILLSLLLTEWIFRNSYRNFEKRGGFASAKTEMQRLTEQV